MRDRTVSLPCLIVSAVAYALAAVSCLVSMALLLFSDETALMLVTLLLAAGLTVFATAASRGGR